MSTPNLPYTVTSEYSDTPADVAGLMPLVGNAVERLQVKRGEIVAVSFPTGTRGSVAVPVRQPDVVTGPDGEHQVWLNGDERACTCGQPNCLHLNAVAALELAEAVA